MILHVFLACVDAPDSSGGSGLGETAAPDSGPETGGDSGESGETGGATFDGQVDVLIVGAGPAGLAAAIEVEAAGRSVRVLEREDVAGGAANYAGGLMLFSGTPEQEHVGVTDSAAQLLSEWASFTGGDPADPWVAYFAANNVAQVHDWLGGFGIGWTGPGLDQSSGTTPRVHVPVGSGAAVIAALVEQLPADRVVYGATAESLVVDEGRVVGVRWTDGSAEHAWGASAVVVATGGFQHDLERVAALHPELPSSQLTRASFWGADGSGHDMLATVGAATKNLATIGLYSHATFDPAAPEEEVLDFSISGHPWVNTAGERFADESEINSFIVGSTRAAQPDGLAWYLGGPDLEESVFATMDPEVSETLDDLLAGGVGVRGDTVAALAASMGVPATALSATVDRWNSAMGGGADDPWRDPTHPVGEVIAGPPYYAIPLAISAAKAFGGVQVDLRGRVLDEAGVVIPGVYAAGELTGMLGGSIVGDHGFTGSLSAVILGGRVAGENAAAEASSR